MMLRAALGHSAIYGLATILSRGSAMALLLILPLFLTPADYGALSLIMVSAAFVQLVVPLEISQALARFHPTASESEKLLYVSTALWFTAAALALFVVVAEVAAPWLNALLLGDPAYLPALRLALPMMALSALFYLLQSQFRWEFRVSGYAVVSVVFSALTLVLAVGLGLAATRPLDGVVAGQLVAALLAVAMCGIMLKRSYRARLDAATLRRMLRFSLPLVPGSIALYVNLYASRIVLSELSTLDQVGVFTFGSQIAAIVAVAMMGVQAALTPLIMAHHEDPKTPAAIARLLEALVALGVCLCLLLGLFAQPAIDAFAHPNYRPAAALVILLAPAVMMNGLYIFAPGFLIAHKTHWQMGVSIASAAVALALNAMLIPDWGILGAAVASFASATVFVALWFGLSQRLYPLPARWMRLAVFVALAVALAVAGLSLPQLDPAATLLSKAALLTMSILAAVALGLLPLRAAMSAIVEGISRRIVSSGPRP